MSDDIIEALALEIYECLRFYQEFLNEDLRYNIYTDGSAQIIFCGWGYNIDRLDDEHLRIRKCRRTISAFQPTSNCGILDIELANPKWTPAYLAQLIIEDIGVS